MNKMILIAACAAALFCTTGCSKENEYEKCLRESMKNMPELVSKPMIEKSLEKFRAMSASSVAKSPTHRSRPVRIARSFADVSSAFCTMPAISP